MPVSEPFQRNDLLARPYRHILSVVSITLHRRDFSHIQVVLPECHSVREIESPDQLSALPRSGITAMSTRTYTLPPGLGTLSATSTSPLGPWIIKRGSAKPSA